MGKSTSSVVGDEGVRVVDTLVVIYLSGWLPVVVCRIHGPATTSPAATSSQSLLARCLAVLAKWSAIAATIS
jgi:hypothetical protein